MPGAGFVSENGVIIRTGRDSVQMPRKLDTKLVRSKEPAKRREFTVPHNPPFPTFDSSSQVFAGQVSGKSKNSLFENRRVSCGGVTSLKKAVASSHFE